VFLARLLGTTLLGITMNRSLTFGALALASILAPVASAQFSLSGSNIDSATDFGDPSNGSFSGTYTGPSTIFTSFNVTGTLNSVNPATYADEAVLDFNNDTTSNWFQFRPDLTASTYTSINVNRTVDVLAWFNTNDSATVSAFETYDDGAGADSNWQSISTTFRGSLNATSLGTLGPNVTFDTFGSTIVDTEIAVYSLNGTLIGQNDDSTSGLLSELALTGLGAGSYLVVVGGYDSGFSDSFAIAGYVEDTETGAGVLNVNGALGGSYTIGANEFEVYSFEVVPEPGTMIALGVGAAALLRRRSKKS